MKNTSLIIALLRLEEAEVNAVRGGRKAIEKLEAKVLHLNAELDMENKFKVDLNKKHNKAERKFREMEFQWEEEKKSSNRLQVNCSTFFILATFDQNECAQIYVL